MGKGRAASERGCGQRGVDSIVGKGEKGEIRETAERRREGTGESEAGEIDGSDDGGGAAAGDPGPVAGVGVRRVPVGQDIVGIREEALSEEKGEAFLVEGEREVWNKEDEAEQRKHGRRIHAAVLQKLNHGLVDTYCMRFD